MPKGMADGTSMASGAKGAAAVQDMARGPRRMVQDRRMSCKVVMEEGGWGWGGRGADVEGRSRKTEAARMTNLPCL